MTLRINLIFIEKRFKLQKEVGGKTLNLVLHNNVELSEVLPELMALKKLNKLKLSEMLYPIHN